MLIVAKSFSLCLAVLLIGGLSVHANGQRRPAYVPYCSLFDPGYEGQKVSSRALISYSTVTRVDGADPFLYSAGCNGPDFFAIWEIEAAAWNRWERFFAKLPRQRHLILEIEFEGKPTVETSQLFGSLDGWARAQVDVSKITSIRDVTASPTAVRPDHDAARPNIERIERVKSDLREFLQSLPAPNEAYNSIKNSVTDEFIFVNSEGKTFTKAQFFALSSAFPPSSAGWKESVTSFSTTSKTATSIVWRGKQQLNFPDGRTQTFYCDVTGVLRNGKWFFLRAEMASADRDR